jgi:hypothetical protein
MPNIVAKVHLHPIGLLDLTSECLQPQANLTITTMAGSSLRRGSWKRSSVSASHIAGLACRGVTIGAAVRMLNRRF